MKETIACLILRISTNGNKPAPKKLSLKSDPQTQTDREPQSLPPKPEALHRASALHTQTNGILPVRRRGLLPRANPTATRRRTRVQRTTGQVFPCRCK